MKKINNINKALVLLAVISVMFACERGLSDDVEFASFPTTGDIFTDAPVGLTDEFFVSFDPAGGANTQGFGTDDNVAFEGSSSIRIDVDFFLYSPSINFPFPNPFGCFLI